MVGLMMMIVLSISAYADASIIGNFGVDTIHEKYYVDPGSTTDFETKLAGCGNPCTIVIPNGTYSPTAQIPISRGNLTLEFERSAQFELGGVPTGFDLGGWLVFNGNNDHVHISGGQFEHADWVFRFNSTSDSEDISISDVIFKNLKYGAIKFHQNNSVNNVDLSSIHITDNWFMNVTRFSDRDGASSILFRHMLADVSQNVGYYDVEISNNKFYTVGSGIRTYNEDSNSDRSFNMTGVKIYANYFQDIGMKSRSIGHAIALSEGTTSSNGTNYRGVVIEMNQVYNVYNTTGTLEDHEGIYFKSGDTTVVNNYLYNAGYFAIGVKGAQDNAHVKDNTIIYTDDYDTDRDICCGIRGYARYNLQITGNTVVGANANNDAVIRRTCGIEVSGYAYNATVTGNTVQNANYGICGGASVGGLIPGYVQIRYNTVYGSINSDYLLGQLQNYSMINVNGSRIEYIGYQMKLGDIEGRINLNSLAHTIALDDITLGDTSYLVVDTEGAAATDDLNCTYGGNEGDLIYIRQSNDARDIIVRSDKTCVPVDGRMIISGNNTISDCELKNRNGILECIHIDGKAWNCICRQI